jgi:hypothetical protein
MTVVLGGLIGFEVGRAYMHRGHEKCAHVHTHTHTVLKWKTSR